MKLLGIASTGGQAKLMIQSSEILVNGVIETRRGRQLISGDRVTVGQQTFEVDLENSGSWLNNEIPDFFKKSGIWAFELTNYQTQQSQQRVNQVKRSNYLRFWPTSDF